MTGQWPSDRVSKAAKSKQEPYPSFICGACSKVRYADYPVHHAEGRKAAENDFKELLELANGMRSNDLNLFDSRIKFIAWKKARGIE